MGDVKERVEVVAISLRQRVRSLLGVVFLALLLVALSFVLLQITVSRADAALNVEIISAYNLVVDSNVGSPSTYAPRVATVIGKFCNPGPDPLTDVYGYIGDGTTPGTYPVRDSDTGAGDFGPDGIWNYLRNTGDYALRHVGAASDASRYIGTIEAGECKYQYWSFEYPACENLGGEWQDPYCAGGTDPTWGPSVKPEDDFSLQFTIWGTGDDGGATRDGSETRTVTMRNEISAMANKIEPNGNPSGRWFNTEDDTVRVGDVITTNGILYSLGNVRFGFDNDDDFSPDYNAWMQPISQPDYDPTCFRLIRTSGVLTVTRGGGNPDMIVNFTDQLYFTDLPPDNTNVRGEVYYTFLALDGPCNVSLSPYQEVASGFDNEKFNGDYGAGIPPVVSLEPDVTVSKASAPDTIAAGSATTYTIPFANTGTAPAGLTLSTSGLNMPLVISDTVPDGMEYVGGSAIYSITGGITATIRYSTDSGATWSTADPGTTTSTWPNNKVIIQWWLNESLPAGSTGNYARYRAQVPSAGYTGSNIIENTACVGLGDAEPFACDTTITLVEGTGAIGDFVWRDENNDGQQTDETGNGINGVTVSLYWDKNGDDQLDDGDVLLSTQDTYTSGSAGYYQFTGLPAADYLVVADGGDVRALYPGYRLTTPAFYTVTLAAGGSYQTADFGYGPSLSMEKRMLPASDACDGYEGREVVYGISLANERPGTGETVAGGCRYPVWSSTGSTASPPKNFTNDYLAYGVPDDSFAYGNFSIGANRWVEGTGFDPGGTGGTIGAVEAVFRVYVDPSPTNDYAVAELYQSGVTDPLTDTIFTTAQLSALVGQANTGYLTWTLPSSVAPGGSWDRSDFALLTLHFAPDKDGGADDSTIYIDAIGFRATTGDACPAIDDDDIMTSVPLTDTYDTTYLQFVSAEPLHTVVNTTTGVITWTNVGPIYPGETRNVYVRFLAKPISGTSSVTVTNSAGSTGTEFSDGGSANDVYDTASGSICQAGSINGYVYSDPDSSGWNYSPGAGDLPIPAVEVTLYGCYDADEGFLITAPGNNNTCTEAGGAWLERAAQLTDADGYYEFNGLLNGFYYVQVTTATLPGSVTQTAEAADNQSVTGTLPDTTANGGGDNNSTWGDPTGDLDQNPDIFNPIDSAGETIGGVNFGYTINPAVYGSVWEDNNSDGDKDDGEGPIGSVTVGLYTGSCGGTPVVTTTTDADGRYRFGDLTASITYYIAVYTNTLPGGASAWTQTGENDGSINNCISFTAVAGTLSGSHDFGFRNVGSYTLGDTVYYDWNGDGTQQPSSEEGIPNITVSLYEDNNGNGVVDAGVDALIAISTTSGSGFYQFSSLPADEYLVVVDTADPDSPAAVVQTQDPDEDPGVCDTCDSRGKADTTGGSVDDVDFGYQPSGSGAIGDTVWRDMDGDGSQSGPQETGIANITVWLEVDLNGDGTYSRVLTDTTDADGKYLFEDLPDGSYRVVVDTSDSDVPEGPGGFAYVPSTATTQSATISGGNTYLDADFGFTPLAVVGDMVYYDANANGDEDLNEVGISGVEVRLYNQSGVTVTIGGVEVAPNGYISTTTSDGTDGNPVGWYQFAGLETGGVTNPYTYTVEMQAGSMTQTADPDRDGWACGDLDTPSNYSGVTCDNETTVLVFPGTVFLGADFGYRATGVIGDYVWYDGDDDGVQDAGEVGIAGVVVTATNGTTTYTITTDYDGGYTFANLPDDTWEIIVGDYDDGTPFALTPTLSNTNAITSGVGSMGTRSVDVTLSGGVVSGIDLDQDGIDDVDPSQCGGCSLDLNIDFGFIETGTRTISGHVFFDAGGSTDTLTDTIAVADTPYADITVYLWKDGLIVGQTTTDASGAYTFTNVAADSGYTVAVDRSGLLSLMEVTASPNAGYSYNTVDTTGGDVTDQDFGVYENMDLGDLPESYNFGSGGLNTTYNTPFASDGPMHINDSGAISPTIYLGETWDAEADGAPNEDAGVGGGNGDDGTSSDDEDGVDFPVVWNRGQTATLRITITDADADYTPYLVGWFDWGQDGQFSSSEMIQFGEFDADRPGEREQIAANTYVYTETIDIPGGAELGRVYMRFRLYATQSPPPVISPIGAVTNGEVEDYWETNNNPTAVTLSLFEAAWDGDQVRVTWETALEIDTVGFNLWRSTSPNGVYEQVNDRLIPAESLGGVWGGYYEVVDTDVASDTVYHYRLEELEVGDRRNWYGPVSTGGSDPGDPTSVTFFNVAASSGEVGAWWLMGVVVLIGLPPVALALPTARVRLRKRRR
jgi:hypothetical protein